MTPSATDGRNCVPSAELGEHGSEPPGVGFYIVLTDIFEGPDANMLPDRWSYRLLAAARKTATPADEIIGKFLLVARRYAERRWSLTERVFAHLDAANAFGYVVHEIRFAELPIIDAVEPTVALQANGLGDRRAQFLLQQFLIHRPAGGAAADHTCQFLGSRQCPSMRRSNLLDPHVGRSPHVLIDGATMRHRGHKSIVPRVQPPVCQIASRGKRT